MKKRTQDSGLSQDEMLGFELTSGEHNGKELGDVPCEYLVWMVKNGGAAGTLKYILDYFEDEIEESKEYFVALTLRELAEWSVNPRTR